MPFHIVARGFWEAPGRSHTKIVQQGVAPKFCDERHRENDQALARKALAPAKGVSMERFGRSYHKIVQVYQENVHSLPNLRELF